MRRRSFLQAIAGAAAAAGLAACGPRPNEQGISPGSTAPAQTAANTGENELHLYNWNNYIAEDTVKRFQAACRCRLLQDYYSDNEELLAKLAAGATGYDILVPTGNAVQTLIRQGALRELDHSKLPNLANIKPEFLDLWFDPGNRYSVPYAYSVTLIGYNVERIRDLGVPTDTWALIFEPKHLERIEGKVTVLDSQRELFCAALFYLGYDGNDTDEGRLREARDLILRAKPYWAAFNASSYIKELTIGNIWVAHGYSNDMFQAALDASNAKRPFSIGFSTPGEGAVLGLDNMVMHRSGPRPDLAYEFINYMLEGRNAAELTNMIGSGNPNAAAMQYIAPAIRGNNAIFPDAEHRKHLAMIRDLPRKERRLLNRFWTEIKVR
jgi:spermidine/putrescine transport system substrate-binding protein